MTARTRLKGRPAVQRSVPFGFSALRLYPSQKLASARTLV